MNKHDWEGINFHQKKMIGKKMKKNNLTIALNVLYAKKEKNISCLFQNITQTVKKSYSFHDSKRRKT